MTTEDEELVPTSALALLGECMAANAASTTGILNDLLRSAMADRDCIRDGVQAALATTEWGGTTRQYEQVLNRVRLALVPPEDIKAWYREEHDRVIDGGWADTEFKLNPWQKLWFVDGPA